MDVAASQIARRPTLTRCPFVSNYTGVNYHTMAVRSVPTVYIAYIYLYHPATTMGLAPVGGNEQHKLCTKMINL